MDVVGVGRPTVTVTDYVDASSSVERRSQSPSGRRGVVITVLSRFFPEMSNLVSHGQILSSSLVHRTYTFGPFASGGPSTGVQGEAVGDGTHRDRLGPRDGRTAVWERKETGGHLGRSKSRPRRLDVRLAPGSRVYIPSPSLSVPAVSFRPPRTPSIDLGLLDSSHPPSSERRLRHLWDSHTSDSFPSPRPLSPLGLDSFQDGDSSFLRPLYQPPPSDYPSVGPAGVYGTLWDLSLSGGSESQVQTLPLLPREDHPETVVTLVQTPPEIGGI